MSDDVRELRQRIANLELENARLQRYVEELRDAIQKLVAPAKSELGLSGNLTSRRIFPTTGE